MMVQIPNQKEVIKLMGNVKYLFHNQTETNSYLGAMGLRYLETSEI